MNCKQCSQPAAGRDGLCKLHRILQQVAINTRYPFTPELDRRLTKAYREHGLTGKIVALNELVRVTGYPRYIFLNRASKKGLRTRVYKLWTESEVEYLRTNAGQRSLRAMSKHLNRPVSAVSWKVLQLGMSAALDTGYTRCQLAELFGVKQPVIDKWIGRGWLYFRDERVPYASVEKFVWQHMDKYRLASCEEWWLKTMLKPSIGDMCTVQRKSVTSAGSRVA